MNNNGYNDPPQITLEKPSGSLFTAAGPVLISWRDSDPDSDADIALYYDTHGSGFTGALLADGIKEDPDGSGDTYLWDISGAPEGTYYVFGKITDETSSMASYAPGTVTIDRTPPTVQASPRGGTYSSPQNVVLTANEPATIFFTLDGTNPSSDSPRYGTPIPLTKTTPIKFMAMDRAGNKSTVMVENYTIGDTRRLLISGALFNYPESPNCSRRPSNDEAGMSLAVTGPSAPSGLLTYFFTKTGMNLVSTKITEVNVSDKTATISGAARVNGKVGYAFIATVVDGKNDSFGIIIKKPNGSNYYNALLKPACGGNIWMTPFK